MDNFFIPYRDPLFGIIVFFILILIIAFVNYWWEVYKNKEEEGRIHKFINKFQINESDKEYKIIFEDKNLTFDSITLLAKSYEKIGEYEKSIGIYLFALEKYKKRFQKQALLYLLGKVYLRAGFVERAREIFINSLKISPRHEESLKYLTITYELLKEHKKALEVLDALEELGVDVKKEKNYILALLILRSDKNKQEIRNTLYKLCEHRAIQRIYVEFLMQNDINLDYEELKEFDFYNLFDLLWYYKKIDFGSLNGIPLVRDILSAKGKLKTDKESEVFELEVLKHLLNDSYHKAGIMFEFLCISCKNTYPFYFHRCPNCHSFDSVKILSKIIKKENLNEKNLSLL